MVLMPNRPDRTLAAVAARAAGFTLIEVLIATALLASALIGVVPLFIRSMANNLEGSRLSEVTSQSRTHLEALYSLPFTALQLTVPAGQTMLLTRELFSRDQERWFDEASFPSTERPAYSRTIRVRQFSSGSVSNIDRLFEASEALDGATPASLVHLKQIEVRVDTGRPSTLNVRGARKAITLRLLKSF